MTRSYGETTANQIIDNHHALVMASLDGNLEPLQALIAVTAQSGYIAGYGAAASEMGVTL